MKIKLSYIFGVIASALILMLFSSISNSQIILSEVMFDPIGNENYDEFIEIYNTSPTTTINLAGWQISDSSDADFITGYEMGMLLKPQQFGIILDAGYFENSRQYENLIPATALILTIDDAALGKQGLSNSVAEPIILVSSKGDTVAKYRYTLNNQSGFSDEKRNLLGADSPENWANSKVLNGTPGFENSVRQFDYDVKLDLLGFPPETIHGQAITLIASVTNVGIKSISNIKISFFEDNNSDSILTAAEQIGQSSFVSDSLKAGENYQAQTHIDSLTSGPHFFFAQAYSPHDRDTSNNLASTIVKVGFRSSIVIINEIMYRPSAGEPEWFELFNSSDKPINLQYWQFSDTHTDKRIKLADSALFIPANDYLIVVEDSTIYQCFPGIPCKVIVPAQGFPALNNDGDQIVLYDPIGTIIDQVKYETSWGSESGISLERRLWDKESHDPTNWALSQNINGGTPGLNNSISPINFDLEVTQIRFIPANPFPAEELNISVLITNVGLFNISEFQLFCFIDLNQDTIFQDSEAIGKPFTISQTLVRNESTIVMIPFTASRSGRSLFCATVFSEADVNTSNNSYSTILSIGFNKNSLVINEIMYSPPSGQSEWIELYNHQDISVDVQNWSFSDSDSSDRLIVTNNHFKIAPQTFLILAPDSSILSFYDLNNSPLLTIKKFPRLNDDLDRIFIFDANNNIIDEVAYMSNWGGSDSVSLERINPKLSSAESSNWRSCTMISQPGTPGQKNSIYVEVLPDEAELSISPNPFSPDGDGRDDVTVISYQLPFNLSQIHIKIFDIRGRQVRFLVNNQPSGTTSSIIWDGRDDQRHICRMGIYIVYLEAIHYQKGVVKSLKKSVVLAKQL